MSKKIKGITIELAGDATPLEKALNQVDKASKNTSKELNQINRALKFDSNNIVLLEQKFEVLQDAISHTSTRLSALKQAQAEVDRQFKAGEIDAKTYREFQREIQKTESMLKNFKQQVKDTKAKIEVQADTSKLDKIKSEFKSLASEAKKVGKEIGDNIAKGAAAGTAAIGGLAVAGNETATDLARMRAVMSNLGFDIDEAFENVFQQAVAVTGEMDSTVEAFNNLANTNMSQSQLLQSMEHLTGAAIQFSDTLKLEGLADGLQETLATGKAVGQFGEYLERSGMDLEKFDAGLAKAAKQGKGVDYVLQTLSKVGAKDFLDSYKEMNSTIHENQMAQAELEVQTGKLSETLAPLTTAVKEVVASLLEWMNENPMLAQTLLVILGAISGLAGALAILGPVISGAVQVFGLLGKILPLVGRAFTAITGPIGIAIAILTTAVPLIISNWESISEFFSNLWNGIKSIFETVVTAIVGFLSSAWEGIKNTISTVWNGIKDFFTQYWQTIITIFSGPIGLIIELITSNWETIKNTTITVWDFIKTSLSTAWDTIKSTSTNVWNGIKNTLVGIWNGIKNTASNLWNGLKTAIITPVNLIQNAVTNAFQNMKDKIAIIWSGLKTVVKAPINTVIRMINSFIRGLNKIEAPDWVPKIGGKSINIPEIPMLARGTNYFKGGLAIVGEQGPELVEMPVGSKVIPNDKTQQMLGRNIEININFGSLVIRDDTDITKLSRSLREEMDRSLLARGIR